MNAFLAKIDMIDKKVLCRCDLKTVQVNMGDLCNQSCKHCHVNAGPSGGKTMKKEIIDEVLRFIGNGRDLVLDITGGAPEMNEHFEYFVKSARPLVKEVIIRSNLTVLLEKGKEHLPAFFKENGARLICSMPCYTRENVDSQRGNGVYEKSIKALRMLNGEGYGIDPGLIMDLAYNPGGSSIPAPQEELEKNYKKILQEDAGIGFNRLITITNMPINRFKDELKDRDKYDEYMELLEENFNKDVVVNIMCRSLLSVGFDGSLYDCDFNQAIGRLLRNMSGEKLRIGSLDPASLSGREIDFGDHCFCCTAGAGSSCQGALGEDKIKGTRNMVRKYYGEVLSSGADLKTNACCNTGDVPRYITKITALIEPEIKKKFYGCGSPIPPELKARSVLDLGCGTGKDTYIISYLAGENGEVVGVDMTQEQLDVALKYLDVHMEKFKFSRTNVRFLKGHIEDLRELAIKDDAFDVVVSNCVVNLSARKDLVLSEVYRVLKQGGEFYFSDVFVDRRLPEWMKDDPVLVGECLGGALYRKDFERMANKAGFADIRVYSIKTLKFSDDEIKEKVGPAEFCSITYRMFKIEGLEDACENYGQTAEYLGGIDHFPDVFMLDAAHKFFKGRSAPVCGNTADMLQRSRFSKYFSVNGDKRIHYGSFPGCGDIFVQEGNGSCNDAFGESCC